MKYKVKKAIKFILEETFYISFLVGLIILLKVIS